MCQYQLTVACRPYYLLPGRPGASGLHSGRLPSFIGRAQQHDGKAAVLGISGVMAVQDDRFGIASNALDLGVWDTGGKHSPKCAVCTLGA